MMARSTTRSNQRPDTLMRDRLPPARQNPLATHGRTIHWVIRVGLTAYRRLPLYSYKQTSLPCAGMSQMCQKRSTQPMSRCSPASPSTADINLYQGVTHMKGSFNVAESGGGSYRLLAILRWVMVVVFVSFGMQKFTLQSAQGIVQFISNSPFLFLGYRYSASGE